VALELRLSGIGDGSDANRIHPGRDLFARVELGIELGEALSIGAALKWIGTRLDRTAFEPLKRSSAYCDQLIDFPNSPSLITSMRAWPCRRTTAATDWVRHVS